ncbi:hypothetical protein [Flavisolibacter tropicus]|uniref:Outer membrane protein beta-barrel domain-containing protein n=1 Tax=Flavisolibacter tropicus TaxID=1492898 RepID=A0A172TQZ1_9BACT|nr:hypothetical protein [Flavisolibacter tropicus]ANE49495.1 hypothetical protein SY85_02250 [Flavisolibacter tropicus]
MTVPCASVGAVNVNYNASEKLTTTASYSNFQTFTNVKPQFQYINQLTPYDNLDTLNFMQLSQNANVNINYVLGRDPQLPQNLNVNLSFQDAFDKQGGIITKGNNSQFYNLASTYSRTNVKKAYTLSRALNMTYNTIGTTQMITAGPTLMANKQLFEKKVQTGASVSYNITHNLEAVQGQVALLRVNGGYSYKKKHLLNLSAVTMYRTMNNREAQNDVTVNLSYNYNF